MAILQYLWLKANRNKTKCKKVEKIQVGVNKMTNSVILGILPCYKYTLQTHLFLIN